jgi:NlpC/P60 family putative phage cell wall peptidase
MQVHEHEMRERIVAEARSWLGTKYHHMARVKGAGVDCLQILIGIYSAVGLVPGDIDPGYYPNDWMLHRSEERYLEGVSQYAHELPEGSEAKPGDFVVYLFGRCFSHSAIVLEPGLFVHALVNQSVQLTDPAQPPLAGRQSKVFTFFPESA